MEAVVLGGLGKNNQGQNLSERGAGFI